LTPRRNPVSPAARLANIFRMCAAAAGLMLIMSLDLYLLSPSISDFFSPRLRPIRRASKHSPKLLPSLTLYRRVHWSESESGDGFQTPNLQELSNDAPSRGRSG
jgi:hypothetical protein